MEQYSHGKIEKKWQKKWFETDHIFEVKEDKDKKKFYGLVEFPYPSGDGLHTGHLRSNTAMDIISRKRRMQGYNVLYPMGYDAFGLPAENYAVKVGVKPQISIAKNVETFTKQLKETGFSFDWSRSFSTTDPDYYKWTQWIFIKMFENGLASKKTETINWCVSCKIGLANEEVVGGACERCGGEVVKKDKQQWILEITKYADRLIEGLDNVDYLERIKTGQINWIGKSNGARVDFKVAGDEEVLSVFTTRPDTLFGATFMVVAPEHSLVEANSDKISNIDEVREYVSLAKKKSDIERSDQTKEKTGVELKGIKIINPVTNKEIPVFVADYVMMGYGTGAIMAVPAHDERDFDFARKYDLEVVEVISGGDVTKEAYTDIYNGKMVNSEFLDGLGPKEAISKMADWLKEKGLGESTTEYKLRDWIFSRQRYWGEPIPMVNCDKCAKKVKESVSLSFYRQDTWDQLLSGRKTIETRALNPEEKDRFFGDIGVGDSFCAVNKKTDERKYFEVTNVWQFKNLEELFEKTELLPLIDPDDDNITLESWVKAYAKNAPDYLDRINKNGLIAWEVKSIVPGWVPVPEKELPIELPDIDDFMPTENGDSPLAKVSDWIKTSCPKCGGDARRETDVMPNWAGSNWYFIRYADPKNDKMMIDPEKAKYWLPVDWYNGGMEHTTLHLLYSRFVFKFLYDIGAVPKEIGDEPYAKRTAHGMILGHGGVKMSKSKGNVINPDEYLEKYGADTVRVYEMFMGPFDQTIAWDDKGVVGVYRFLNRIWALQNKVKEGVESKDVTRVLHQTIKKVGQDIEEMRFNTAVSAMMILVNEMEKAEFIDSDVWKKFVLILSPFAPHISEELWSLSGEKESLVYESWPEFDEALTKEDEIELVVQVNGKVRDKIKVEAGISEGDAKKVALESEVVSKWLEGKEPKKVIFIQGKLVSIVV